IDISGVLGETILPALAPTTVMMPLNGAEMNVFCSCACAAATSAAADLTCASPAEMSCGVEPASLSAKFFLLASRSDCADVTAEIEALMFVRAVATAALYVSSVACGTCVDGMARLMAAPASESRDAIADRLLCASKDACDRSAEAPSANTAPLHATRALSAARRFDSTDVLRLESLMEKVSDGLVRGLEINWSSVLCTPAPPAPGTLFVFFVKPLRFPPS